MKNILIGITSSIASYKIYELIRLYRKSDYNVKVVLTPNSLNFVSPLVLETLSNNKVFYEQFNPRNDVEHINLTQWADIFVLAPIGANTLSKIAHGIADNLLTSIFCAFLGSKKPILLAPAMNTDMWDNPAVQKNIEQLKSYGCSIINPENGFLACGSEGCGRLSDINTIYLNSLRCLFQNKNNNSKKITVTVGGTREYIDTVRYITNSSSGKMGTALADWAYKKGYEVTAVSCIKLNRPYKVIEVDTAQKMLDEILQQDFNYLIMASAVCDFKTETLGKKISKENIDKEFNLKLMKNPDIIRTVSKNKKDYQKIIGFCLTDDNVINCAKRKLHDKNLDYIVANDVKTALNTDTNRVTILDKSDKIINIDTDTKENIAKRILEVVCD